MLEPQEEILNGNPGRLPGGHRHFDLFPGFNGLVDPRAPFTAFGKPARRLVDDHHFPFANHVMMVSLEFSVHLDGSLHVFVYIDQSYGIHQLGLR